MYDYIYKTLKNLENKDVSDLGCKIYEELKSRLMYWSAAKTMHHAYLSGLLYHTYRMVAAAEILSAIYPSCNRDLVICGCALHDIGKIKELSTDSLGKVNYKLNKCLCIIIFNNIINKCLINLNDIKRKLLYIVK